MRSAATFLYAHLSFTQARGESVNRADPSHPSLPLFAQVLADAFLPLSFWAISSRASRTFASSLATGPLSYLRSLNLNFFRFLLFPINHQPPADAFFDGHNVNDADNDDDAAALLDRSIWLFLMF
uniref:Putative secreted protein n=1 Tax=Anopheles darlingi TaxID=43151 RepID=A0A2M4DKP4_ANODA